MISLLEGPSASIEVFKIPTPTAARPLANCNSQLYA